MKKIVLIGASGHGKVVADIARLNGYEDISFLDDNEDNSVCGKYSVVGKTDCYKDFDCDFFVSIGNARVRKHIMEKLICDEKSLPVLIHPNSIIAEDVSIDVGTVVMAGTVINSGTSIGKGCIINTCSSVDHDNSIGDYVHIAVGAHLCGTVKVGNDTWIGAGATLINNISIFDGCVIGAGAVIIDDINERGTYVGVPAKKYENSYTY